MLGPEVGVVWDVERVRHQAARKVGGSGVSCGPLRAPAPLLQVEEFEEQYGVRLPESYREFLLRVGNGGAGPGYGLYSLGGFEMRRSHHEDWCTLDGFLSTPFPHTDYWNDQYDEDPWVAAGTLPIGTLGCTMNMVLVVTGATRGQVWMDDRGADGGLIPYSPFADWYLGWLAG